MSGFNSDIKTNMENSRNSLRRIARHDEQQFSKDSLVNVIEKYVKKVDLMNETVLVPCRLMDKQVGDSTDIVQPPPKTSQTSHQMHMSGVNGVHRLHQQSVHELLHSANLHNLFTVLNSLKNDLLWTRNEVTDDINDIYYDKQNINTTLMSQMSISSSVSNDSTSPQQSAIVTTATSDDNNKSTTNSQQQNGNNVTQVASTKGHNRRPSTASMTSANSVSNLSDSESEISNENDSGMESEGNCNGSQSSGGSTTSDSLKQQNLDRASEMARKCKHHLAALHRCLEQMTETAEYVSARYQSDIGSV